MTAKPEIVYEYDDYTIDEKRVLKEPRPHEEVMRELREKVQGIRNKHHTKETA